MPSRCCVPSCKGNYDRGPKVSTYQFPKDEALALKWKIAIKRANFQITKHSRVCELHFLESDFQRVSSMFDEKTGRTVSASLSVARLIPGSIPSQFPNLPSYHSVKPTRKRENPDSRRLRLQQQALKAALESSAKAKAEYDLQHTFTSIEDIHSKLKSLLDCNVWSIIFKNDKVIIMNISTDLAPHVQFSAVVNTQLMVSAFVEDTEVSKLGKNNLPVKVTHFDILNDILNHLVNYHQKLALNKDQFKDYTNKMCNNLKELRVNCEGNTNVLKFIEEQLLLFSSDKHGMKYSSDLTSFSRSLFSLAPPAYRFIRQSGFILLPHPNTISRVGNQLNCNPQADKLNSNILSHIIQNDARNDMMSS